MTAPAPRLGGIQDPGAGPGTGIDVATVAGEPLAEIRRWLEHARAAGVTDAETMILSTADDDGWPQGRAVILRGLDHGLVLFTHLDSAKARDLDRTGRGALTFVWTAVQRQIRVAGSVERLSDEEADTHFATRPRDAQLAAWASDQRSVVASRATLEAELDRVRRRFEGRPVPRPEFFGGYRVVPVTVELWQGRDDRLHDRVRYRATPAGWAIERVAP